MSSSEEYKSSDTNEDSEESSAPRRGRGAVPRALSNRKVKQASPSPSRSQPKRYTTAEMDREIATGMYKEQSSSSDDSDGIKSDNVSSDDGQEVIAAATKKAKPRIKLSARRSPPKKKTGYKQPLSKRVAPEKKKSTNSGGGKSKKKNGKKDGFIADSDEDEKLSSEEEEMSDKSSGEEWDANHSDARNSSEEESEQDSDSDSDFGAPKRKKKQGGKKKAAAKGGRGGKKAKSTTPAKSTRATRQTTYQQQSDSSDEEQEDEIQYETTPGGKRRPRRQCKTLTEQKNRKAIQSDMLSEKEALGNMLEDDDKELLANSDSSGDSDGSEELVTQPKRRGGSAKKKKKKGISPKSKSKYDDDDEDYDEDAPSSDKSDDDDEDMSDYEEESDTAPKRRSTRQRSSPRNGSKKTSYKDVDDSAEDIGTADEDSNDEETGPSILMSPARKSNATGIYGHSPGSRKMARMGRSPLDVHEDDGSESDDSGDKGRSKKKREPKKKRRKVGSDESESEHSSEEDDDGGGGKKSPPMSQLKTTHINCPSTTDEITMAPLPKNKPHVCYIAPDGKTRHCFSIDTLYRIAITSKSNEPSNSIVSLIDNSQKLKFLQPPHFRSPMEDDLLDQIASRFGRGALNIENSAICKKINGTSYSISGGDLDEFDEDGEYIGYAAAGGGGGSNFQERFERYLQSLMGSQDIYCCPLCYNESDRRLGNAQDEEMLEDDGSDEDDDEQGASGDRFHYMDDPMTILGNLDDHEFQVASTFCFRYLKDVKEHLKVVHGCNIKEIAGNDLYKRFQIRTGDGLLQSWLKRSLRKTTVQGDMMRYWLQGENQSFVLLLSQIDKGGATGEHSGEYGSDFSFSFPNRAKKIWRDVSAPYLKGSADLRDFIAGDNEESDEDGEEVPVNPNFTPPEMDRNKFKSPEEQMIETLLKKNRRRKDLLGSEASSSSDDGEKDDDKSSDSELEVLPKPQQYEIESEEDEWTKGKGIKEAKRRAKRGDSDDDSVFNSDTEKKPKVANGSASKRVIGGDDNDSDSSDSDGVNPKLPSFRKTHKKSAHQLNFSDSDTVPVKYSKAKAPANGGGSARKRVMESSDEESF